MKRVNGVKHTAINTLLCKPGSNAIENAFLESPNQFKRKISYDVECDIVYDMNTRSYDVLFRICDVAYDCNIRYRM